MMRLKRLLWRITIVAFLMCVALYPSLTIAQEDDLYSFEVEEFTKKTWEWKGEISAISTTKFFNQDAVAFPLKFENEAIQAEEREIQIVLESRWDWDWSRLYVMGEASTLYSTIPDVNAEDAFLREGYWQLSKFDPSVLEIGKRLLRWGKGYAFNPVAFLERPKNPEDPEASREGLWMVQGLWIPGAFSGLDNTSVTAVYLPLRQDINEDYQSHIPHENVWGLKLYALIDTTDIDLYFVQSEEKDEINWGVDFASNITVNFEIHGEYARKIDSDYDELQALLGLRYLTENDVTWIVEVYHDSSGWTAEESAERYEQIENKSPLKAKPLLSQIQKQKTISQNYGYLQASAKEPFEWLYFTPSLALLHNQDDHSYNTITQLNYAPANNWTFLVSWQHFSGEDHTQYGESLAQNKLEMKATYAF